MLENTKKNTSVNLNHSVFKCIKSLCSKNNISIAELERELKFSNGSIYKWNTSNPSIDKIIKVAIRFGVSSDYLLGLEKTVE